MMVQTTDSEYLALILEEIRKIKERLDYLDKGERLNG